MDCRQNCGACCIAPSISSPIPGMPDGKKAGERCIQLSTDNQCKIFGMPGRPDVCMSLMPSYEMCGDHSTHAIVWLSKLEQLTSPASGT